jgi:hypothetical protein
MFFGPVIMIIFFVAGAAVVFFMLRGAMFHRGHAGAAGMMSCCETGLQPSFERAAARNDDTLPANASPAFDEYRAETLRRLEREQGEFQEFVEHLRTARDKAEFDQFIAERRGPPPA